jgi:hypothetical protein
VGLGVGFAQAPLLVPELLRLIDQSCKSSPDAYLLALSSSLLIGCIVLPLLIAVTLRQWSKTDMINDDVQDIVALKSPEAGSLRPGLLLLVKVLNGSKPADIPVEQPTTVALSVNLNVLQEGNPTTGAFSGPAGAAAARGIPPGCRTARGSGTPGAAQAGG